MSAALTSVLDPFAMEQAGIRASRMVGRYGYTRDDWEDLRQDLLLDCLERLPQFDSGRGNMRGFIFGVVRNEAAKLAVRGRRASAHREFEPEAGKIEAAAVSRPDAELDVRLDVQAVLERLPRHLQILARQLTEMSVPEICRETGKSRSRIYQWIAEIRRAFIDAGITPASLASRGGAR